MHEQDDRFIGAIGLLRMGQPHDGRFALRRDPSRSCLALPSGPRLGDESFRETVEREIAWTFDLERGRDFIVSSVPRLHYGTRLVEECGRAVDYGVEFYLADLYGRRGRERFAEDPLNVWVDRQTLLSGRLEQEEIALEQVRLLVAADVLGYE